MLGPAWTNLHAAAPRRAVSSAAPPSTIARPPCPARTGLTPQPQEVTMTNVLAFRSTTALVALVLLITAVLATGAAAAPSATCPVCGKNLIKNPGAEGGRGDHGRRRLRRGARLDERGGPVRRRLVHLPERVVLCPLEGLAEERGRTTSSEARQPRPSRRRRRSASRRSTFRPPRLDARRRSAGGSATT